MSKRKSGERLRCVCGSSTWTIDKTVNLLAAAGTNPTVYIVKCSACRKQPANLGVPP